MILQSISCSFIGSLRRVNTAAAVELLANKLWYRGKAKIKRRFSGAQEAPAPRPSPITKIPRELVEAVISYFIYDTPTLLACSMTCYLWYIAAVPHLHYSLTTDQSSICRYYPKRRWPIPLRESYKLGLLPLVKQLRIRKSGYRSTDFTSEQFYSSALRYFSALTNLRELGIDDLEVSNFMPNIRRCFGHFASTLQFLALREPKGSCREILYLIGLFPNLQDLKLCYPFPTEEQETTVDTALVPLSVPPLRGRLTLTCFTRRKLMEDMIALFGGLRFRCMDLFRVNCVQLLLNACAETLERLRLYPTELIYGEDFFENRGKRTQAKNLQQMVELRAGISICHETGPSGRSKLLLDRLSPRVMALLVSSKPCSPPSCPIYPSTLLSPTGTLMLIIMYVLGESLFVCMICP